jgi:transcriptional regulator with XRE-family HTH domain
MTSPRATKEWIKAVADYLNMTISALASNSGLAPSTVTRFMNDGTNKLTVQDKTLDAIAIYSGVPKHVLPGTRTLPGMGESEAVLYDPRRDAELPDWVLAAIAAIKGNRNGIEPWVVKGWALELLGIIPGDILVIDQNRRPKNGDIVIAQISDLVTGSAETVMRHYQAPFLVTHSAKMGPTRPEQVDEDRVIIMGVRAGLIRPYN